MITSKTYNMNAGVNFIESSELAFTPVYLVKREGVQHDKYLSGDANRTHVHNSSLGRISFPTVAHEDGERVFVLYKKTSPVVTPIPGICNGVVISGVLPEGIVGVPYSYGFVLTGGEPFTLTDVTAPAWATVSLSGAVVTVSGTPDTETEETIEFTVTNCTAGSDTISQDFNVMGVDSEITITNNSPSGVWITAVGGVPWSLITGTFPLTYPNVITGAHSAYVGSISVTIQGIMFTQGLKLYRNGIILETIPVYADTTYNLASQTFLSSDTIQIVLE